jgi:hypothetical protein
MKSFSRIRIPGVLALLLVCALIAPAQWDKKPYTEWSEREAQKLLDDSPWAKIQTFTDSTTGNARQDSNASRIAGTVNINFRIRFFSAKPVRQATTRIIELQQKSNIDAEFAGRLRALANADFKDHIVVTVLCDADRQSYQIQEATALLHARSTADLKNDTFLEVKGKKVYIQEYQPPRGDGFGARFIFPRLVDGAPFITPETSEVRFYSELSKGVAARPGPAGSASTPLVYTLNMRFKVSAMNFGGKLEY